MTQFNDDIKKLPHIISALETKLLPQDETEPSTESSETDDKEDQLSFFNK